MKSSTPATTSRPRDGELGDSAEKPPDPKREQSTKANKPKLRTPDEWARELGHVRRRRVDVQLAGLPSGPKLSSQFRCARQLHKWRQDEIDGYRPVSLTKEQFVAALKAASVGKVNVEAMAEHRRPKTQESA